MKDTCAIILIVAMSNAYSSIGATEVLDTRMPDVTQRGPLWLHKGEPITGIMRRIESDGVLTMLPLKAGFVTGALYATSREGVRRREGAFDKSMPVGLHRTWWGDGKKQSEHHYVGGIPEGKSKTWYQSGAIYETHQYKLGQEDGPQRVWFEDGRLKANYEVRDGRRYGNFGAMGCIGGDKPKPPRFDGLSWDATR